MGRGPARDRLPDDEARMVRGGLRKAREKMGVSMQRLADAMGMGWDVRRVRGALDSSPGRTLRATTARAIFHGLLQYESREFLAKRVSRKESQSRHTAVIHIISQLLKESPTFRKWFAGDPEEAARAGRAFLPALLVPEKIADVAKDLADEVTRTPGVKPRIRAAIADNLEKALRRHGAGYAHGAYDTLRENGIDEPTARRVLAVFGWRYNDKKRGS
jgi:transcriptional regulator with XRE-family HTH domain